MGLDPQQLQNLTTVLGISEANKRSREEQAKLAAMQGEVAALRQAQELHSQKPQCPVCGGRLDGEFRRCMHCAADLIWLEGVPGEPGKEQELMARIEEKKRSAEQERLQAEIAARQPRVVQCNQCGTHFNFDPQSPSACPTCTSNKQFENVILWIWLIFGAFVIVAGIGACIQIAKIDASLR